MGKTINTLKKNKEFGYVYRRGQRIKFSNFAFIYVKSRYGGLRAGFSVSKKVGNSVVRNLCRRRLKEALRQYLPFISGNFSIVFSAFPQIAAADYKTIKDEIEQALLCVGILKKDKL